MKKKKATQQSAYRSDGWSNLLTGLGTLVRDKRTAATFETKTLAPGDCEELFRGDDMAARIANLIPLEMTRPGWKVQVQDDKAASEAADAALEELGCDETFLEALVWARVFGGAGILVGAADGQLDSTLPLNESRIQSIDFLTVLDSRELIAVQYYGDPQAKKYGEPEIYRVQPLTLAVATEREVKEAEAKGLVRYVHESRVLRFEGVRLTRRQQRAQYGWGDSIYVRLHERLRDFQASFDGASALLADFAQGILKIEGLADILMSGQKDALIARLQVMDASRSLLRALVLDSREDFERKATPVGGLPELLEKLTQRFAATVEIPVSLLVGQAPAGLNATGDSEMRWFYDRVAASRRRDLLKPLRRLVRLLFLAKRGPTRGKLPANWSVQPGRLWQLTDLEQAQLRKTQAETDAIYLDRKVLRASQVQRSRFGGDEYSVETQLGPGDAVNDDEQDDDQQQEQAEQGRKTAGVALQKRPPDPGESPRKKGSVVTAP